MASPLSDDLAQIHDITIISVEAVGAVPAAISQVAAANIRTSEDGVSRTMFYLPLTDPNMDSTSYSRFAQLLIMLNSFEEGAVIVTRDMTIAGPHQSPIWIAFIVMFDITLMPWHELADYSVYIASRKNGEPNYYPLRPYFEYYQRAVDIYRDEFHSSGIRTVRRVLERLPLVELVGVRDQFRTILVPVAEEQILQPNETIMSSRLGSYGNTNATAPGRCKTCNLAADGCNGHGGIVRLKPRGIKHIPQYAFNPMMLEVSHAGTSASTMTLATGVLRVMCWTSFIREWVQTGYVPLIRMHKTRPAAPGHLLDNLFNNDICPRCSRPIKLTPQALKKSAPIRIVDVRKTQSGTYERATNETELTEKAIMVKIDDTMMPDALGIGTSTYVPPIFILPWMYAGIILRFAAAHPHAFAKIGLDLTSFVINRWPILPPREYNTRASDNSKPGIKNPTMAITDSRIIYKSSRLLSTLHKQAREAMKGRGGVEASALRNTFSNNGRMTWAHQNKYPLDVCTVGSQFSDNIVVMEPFRSNGRIAELVGENALVGVIDTSGRKHMSERNEIYLADDLILPGDVLVDDSSDERWSVKYATPISMPTGRLAVKYTPPVIGGFAIRDVLRTAQTGDRAVQWRNPATLEGSIVAVKLKVLPSYTTTIGDDGEVTLVPTGSPYDSMGQGGPVQERGGGDNDGDESQLNVPPLIRDQNVLFDTLSPAALIRPPGKTPALIYRPHHDPYFALNVITKYPNAMFRVPTDFLGDAHKTYTVSLTDEIRVRILRGRFTRTLSRKSRTYSQIVSKGMRIRPDAPGEHVLYCKGKHLFQMLIPEGMPPVPDVFDIDSVDIVMAPVTKPRMRQIIIAAMVQYGATGHQAQHIIDWISWMIWVLGCINAANLEIAGLSPYSIAPEYIAPQSMHEIYQEALATNPETTEWTYRRYTNEEGNMVGYNQLRFLRALQWAGKGTLSGIGLLGAMRRIVNQLPSYPDDRVTNPLANMVESGGRGSKEAFDQYMSGYGHIMYPYAPLSLPNNSKTKNPFAFYTGPDDPAHSGFIASPLGRGFTLSEQMIINIAAVHAMSLTNIATRREGTDAKIIAGMAAGAATRLRDGVTIVPGLLVGRV